MKTHRLTFFTIINQDYDICMQVISLKQVRISFFKKMKIEITLTQSKLRSKGLKS